MHARITLLVLTLLPLGGCALSSADQPDPTQVRLNDLDTRLGRVERVVNNQSLVALSQRLDALEAQNRQLRGGNEELQNGSEALRKQQRTLYTDLDARIAAIERTLKAEPAPGSAVPSAPAPDDQSAYQKAFESLKSADYPGAIAQFNAFLKAWPASQLLDNAEYWLGEAYYVTHDYDAAAQAFATVGDRWPNSRKAPDALLKLGFTRAEQKRTSDARTTLQEVQRRFPGTDAARLASEKLLKLASDPR